MSKMKDDLIDRMNAERRQPQVFRTIAYVRGYNWVLTPHDHVAGPVTHPGPRESTTLAIMVAVCQCSPCIEQRKEVPKWMGVPQA